MDAIAEYQPDEIIISTLPGDAVGLAAARPASSASRTPPACRSSTSSPTSTQEGLPFDVTLVVANRTASGDALLETLQAARPRASDARSSSSSSRRRAATASARRRARARLAQVRRPRCAPTGLVAAGMIGDPDPYTATMNALQFFRVDDIVISTLPGDPLGLAARRPHRARAQGIEQARRARRAADAPTRPRRSRPWKPPRSPTPPTTTHHGPPDGQPQLARRARDCSGCCFSSSPRSWSSGPSSRPTSSSGSCADDGRLVPDRTDMELPVAVAGVNTAILRVVVVHAALGRDVRSRRGNRFGLQGRDAHDLPARRDVPLRPDQRVRPHRLRAAGHRPGARSSTASPACTAPTSSSA